MVPGADTLRGRGGENPALTASVLREALALAMAMLLTPEAALRELNAVLRRKEEARIYHWFQRTGGYPPRRGTTAPGEPPEA